MACLITYYLINKIYLNKKNIIFLNLGIFYNACICSEVGTFLFVYCYIVAILPSHNNIRIIEWITISSLNHDKEILLILRLMWNIQLINLRAVSKKIIFILITQINRNNLSISNGKEHK